MRILQKTIMMQNKIKTYPITYNGCKIGFLHILGLSSHGFNRGMIALFCCFCI